MNNPAAPLLLSSADRNTLTKWALSATAPYRVVIHAEALADGRRRLGEQSHRDDARHQQLWSPTPGPSRSAPRSGALFYGEHWKIGTIAAQLGCERTPRTPCAADTGSEPITG